MDALDKRVIKGYEFRERIGEGGFGAVYRAYQPSIGREVAIKVILPHHANQPDFVRRFEVEAQYIARLEHPHIVPLYDYWRDPDGAFLVMRWLRGSLRASIERSAWSLDNTARMLDQIASALGTAHREGIVHRDLKPDNILLDEDDNAYLADFGIAKDVHIRDLNKTAEGEFVGSPAYISPEQIRQSEITARTDLYSLGYVLYEMLTGQKPFSDATTASDYIEKHLSSPLPMISIQDSRIPAAVDEVLQTATAKDPSHRYPSAQRFAAAFRAALPNRLPRIPAQPLADPLTEREFDVLKLMVEGLSNKQIAEKLVLAQETVRWYVNKQIYSKLDVHSRQQAVERARSMGLLDRPSERLPSPDSLIIAMPKVDQATIRGEIPVELADSDNPYKGLRAFQESDASDFFGRAALTERLLSRLSEGGDAERFLVLVGASGSGKSSVVRAGLIPALRKGALSTAPHPFIADLMPGSNPLEELEAALLRVAVQPMPGLLEQLRDDRRGLVRAVKRLLPNDNSTELVLVVDQFEETFTLVQDEAVRTHFIDNLLAAATDPRGRVRVILTLRADFYDRPLMYPRLAEMVRSHTEVITPLTAREMEQSIIAPAERVGLRLEPGLVATILKDVGEQPGTLPLLQFALTELFERREGIMLTVDGYKATGGVLGALARRADEIYSFFDNDMQHLARQMFLRLVTLGEGTEDTRRRALLSELAAIDADGGMEDVINAFASYRLLTLDRDPISHSPTVEIAHEALIREWSKLREWLFDSREDIRIQRRLAAAASEWNSGRDRSYLAYGSRLTQFETWAIDTNMALTKEEREYLDASLADRARSERIERERLAHEQKLEKRSRNVLRTLVIVLLVATVVALGLTTLAVSSANEAQSARATSEANLRHAEQIRLASQAENLLDQGAGNIPAMLALTSLRYGYNAQADAALLAASSRGIIAQRFEGHNDFVTAVDLSPDGRTAVTGAGDRGVRLWDVETGEMIRLMTGHTDYIETVEFSPDGSLIVSAGNDRNVILWDAETGEELRRFGEPGMLIWPVIFSHDGQMILGASEDGAAYLWETATGNEIRRFAGDEGQVADVAFSPDDRLILMSAGSLATLWDVQTGDVVREMPHEGRVYAVDFSPDGRLLATGDATTFIHIRDAADGTELRSFAPHGSGMFIVTFSPDGKWIASMGLDWKVIVSDVATGETVWSFDDPMLADSYDNVEWSADMRYIFAGGNLWDVEMQPLPHFLQTSLRGGPWDVRYSRDNRFLLASGPFTGEVRDAETLEPLYSLDPEGGVRNAAFSPDARYVFFSANLDGEPAKRLELATGEIVQVYEGNTTLANGVDYSRDGRYVATAGSDGVARVWEAESGELVWAFEGHHESIGSTYFSRDGQTLLTGGQDGTVRLWDLQNGGEIKRFGGDGIQSIAMVSFSNDGTRVTSSHYDGTVRIWDIDSGALLHTLVGHVGLVWGVEFSPDDTFVATGGFDSTARLWDAQTGAMLRVFTGHEGTIQWVRFSPDGRQLLTAADDTTIGFWNIRLEDDVAYLCSRLRHDFTAAERELYLISDDMLPTCG